MKPTRDILLIEVDKVKTQSASGIFIATDSDEHWKTLPPTGIVRAIGPDVKDTSLLGKRVLFERYSSIVLPKDGDIERRFCNESHILGELLDGAE